MRLSDFKSADSKDKIEITKQKQAEIQKILDYRIIPHENHTVFEVNLKNKTIVKAEYKPPKTLATWAEAVEMYLKRKIKKVDIYNSAPISKSEIIKKENCIYISALNISNAKKILTRDFNIEL